MSEIDVRCIMCGETYKIMTDHKDYEKINITPEKSAYICDLCNNKVRFESDDKKKNPKPI